MRSIANPILPGMYPDPSICRVDGTYYLATSTFEYLPGLPILSSTDLETWSPAGHAIHDGAQFDYTTVADSRGMFAPTIRHHDGLFYVACTMMHDSEVAGNFYVTASDVAGPWSAPVVLPDARGIDPSLFFFEGRAWWIGCREVLDPEFEGETEVWLSELDLDCGELIGEQVVIWTRTMYRAVWAEAPHLYHRDGWFYLVTAEGGTAFEHSVMVARSRDVVGPYLPCPRNPVLTHRHLGHRAGVQYVGHADLVEGDDGEWWMVMLATRPIDGHHVLGRETHLARVTWEDDWPVVNAGLGRLDPPAGRAGRWASEGVPAVEDFLSVRGFPTFAESTPTGLRLGSTGSAFGTQRPLAALLRRVTSTECAITVTLDGLTPDAVCGLVLRNSDATQVRIEVRHSGGAGELQAELVVGHRGERAVAGARLPAGPITLRSELSADGIGWSVAPGDGAPIELGRTPLSAVSTETAGGFVGTTFGPYSTGPEDSAATFVAWSQQDWLV